MDSNFKEEKQELYNIIKKNAFFKGKIILSSGKESDYYIDARRITLSSEGAYYAAKIILALIQDEKYDAVGGPTLGADPLLGAINVLSFMAQQSLRTFIIRKAPKGHGKKQQIEGPPLPESAHVILIDDVATTGKAFVQSIEVLQKENIAVHKAICLVDREDGAKERLSQYGCELIPIFTASDFLKD